MLGHLIYSLTDSIVGTLNLLFRTQVLGHFVYDPRTQVLGHLNYYPRDKVLGPFNLHKSWDPQFTISGLPQELV